MATEQNLILNLPFDDFSGSDTAYDYSQYRHDAAVENADFISGRMGNCIHFDGTGKAEINSNIVTLSGNFTILAWVKTDTMPDGYSGKKLGIFCNTAQLEGYRDYWMDVTPGRWYFIVLRKTGNRVEVLLDNQHVTNLGLPATLTGISILQDVYSSENAYADLDEAKIYDVALTDAEIGNILTTANTITYLLNGNDLKDMGIRVESSEGVLDLPKLKTPASNDWPDYHGKVIDLTDKRFEEREITLNCWMKANGKIDFTERLNHLYDILRADGTQRLYIGIHPTKPLVYEVYSEDGIAPSKRWHDEMMIGTFTLKLKEPDPVKRVIRHQRRNNATKTVSVAFNSPKMVNIYWGDGTKTEDVYGDHTGNNAITHTYENDGIYFIIVAGVIEEITDFTTNGIIVWNKL